jgi:hypothetical protein
MDRTTLNLAALALFACVLHANPQQPEKIHPPAKDPAPPAPPAVPKPPAFVPGSAKIQGEVLNCEIATTRHVPVTVFVNVVKDGQTVTEARTVIETRTVLERRLVPLKDVRAYVIDPKAGDPTKALQPVDATKLPQLLGQTPKPLIALGRTPTTAELKDAKAGSLLLVLSEPKPVPKPVPLPPAPREPAKP